MFKRETISADDAVELALRCETVEFCSGVGVERCYRAVRVVGDMRYTGYGMTALDAVVAVSNRVIEEIPDVPL